MLVTKNWIEKNYNKFNKLYWDGKLPVIEFKINRSRNTWGFASFRYDFMNDTIIPLAITMSNYYDSPENVKIQTLLHEMIHIADYTFQPEHFIHNGRKVSAVKVCTALTELEGIEEAAVICRHVDDADALIAFVGAAREYGKQELVKLLRQTLEDYELPKQFVFMEQLPHNESGKVDKLALKNFL